MKFLDKIALNRLIAIVSSFILSLIKLLSLHQQPTVVEKPKRKRPLKDLLDRVFK